MLLVVILSFDMMHSLIVSNHGVLLSSKGIRANRFWAKRMLASLATDDLQFRDGFTASRRRLYLL